MSVFFSEVKTPEGTHAKTILVCGSRTYTDRPAIRHHLAALLRPGCWPGGLESLPPGCPPKNITIIHGGCRGADSIAGCIAAELGFQVRVFPADWGKHGKAAGPIRNDQMLRIGKPELVIAFTDDLQGSRGTADMVRRALAAGVRVVVVGCEVMNEC